MKPYYQDELTTIYCGDSLEIGPQLEPNSIDAVITDPPYGLEFMGKEWDHGIPGAPFWNGFTKPLKPGAFIFAFGGTRTYHRLACAVEDAGFEIRDCIMWLYGSGFPKSHNISKSIDKAAGAEREVFGNEKNYGATTKAAGKMAYGDYAGEWDITAPATEAAKLWDGYGSALKPAYEPIIVAMKPLDGSFAQNALQYGVAGLNIDAARVAITDGAMMARNNKPGDNGWKNSSGGPNSAAVNGEPTGRWPANIIHDGSEEVTAGFPETGASKAANRGRGYSSDGSNDGYKRPSHDNPKFQNVFGGHNDSGGSASRFFYTAKASKKERTYGWQYLKRTKNPRKLYQQNKARRWSKRAKKFMGSHPTVKPMSLMDYMIKITTMPGNGPVLDPFMGSGKTLLAARKAGRPAIGIDLNPEYCEIAIAQIKAFDAGEPLEDESDFIPTNSRGERLVQANFLQEQNR